MKKIEDLKKKALYAALALVPAIASGIASNLQARADAREKAEKVEKKAAIESEAVIKSSEPIIAEIHEILDMSAEWAEGVGHDIQDMDSELAQLRADVMYCKAYIEFDSRGRSFDRPAAVVEQPDFEYHAPTPVKPKAKLPDNVKEAQQYIKARKEQRCSPGDPLCGSDSL